MTPPADTLAPDPAWFHKPDGIHGVSHTRRVSVHARVIAQAVGVSRWQLEALTRAALWHDIGRVHDGVDPSHGVRSHYKVLSLGLHDGLDDRLCKAVFFAVEQHCTTERYVPAEAARLGDDAEPALHVWRILKDADGLDRVRLGGRWACDPAQLRFDFSRGQIEPAMELLRIVP
jgi:HD superfamily phosphodiesterase